MMQLISSGMVGTYIVVSGEGLCIIVLGAGEISIMGGELVDGLEGGKKMSS